MTEKEINSIVVGLGEVGGALIEVLSEKYHCFGIDENTAVEEYPKDCKILNICIPWGNHFVEIVNEYIERLRPDLTINHSSVPIGTTKKLNGNVIHSPVRGKHPNIKDGLKKYVKFVGYNNDDGLVMGSAYLDKVFKTDFVYNTDCTEFLKIQSLAKYLVYLGLADEINEMAETVGCKFSHVQEWDRTQNKAINDFYDDMKWPVLSAPKGKIGGHCVMQVTKLGVIDEGLNAPIISKVYKKYQNLPLV